MVSSSEFEHSYEFDRGFMNSSSLHGLNSGEEFRITNPMIEDPKLQLFWNIALASYILSGIFVCFIYWWFVLREGDEERRLSNLRKRAKSVAGLGDSAGDLSYAMKRYDLLSDDEYDDEEVDVQGGGAKSALAIKKEKKQVMARFGKETMPERLQTAALTLLLIGCLMVVYMLLRFYGRMGMLCAPFKPHVHIPEIVVLGCLMAVTVLGTIKPTEASYWPTLMLWLLYIPACQLPPFNLSCATLTEDCQDSQHWRVVSAVNHADCTLQGQTSQQIFLTVFLLLPWLFPDRQSLHVMWVWIGVVYVLWSVAYMRYSPDGNSVFGSVDIITRTILLVCTLCISFYKKSVLEKSQRDSFKSDIMHQQSSEKLYNILEFTLPKHVIEPLLMKPNEPWHQSIDQVTIMFVVIDNFDIIVNRFQQRPSKLLQYLNQNFTKMDDICKLNNVQKVETVGEEYVACVGVMPDDVEATRVSGHSAVLGRLFQAASDIMALQHSELQLKIGMHTGPIVAGVIGKKLPRFRLFGDTINTAARMMQKGIVGQAQFGKDTYAILPEGIQTEHRGTVEMKGKGAVDTYLFKGHTNKKEPGANQAAADTAAGKKVEFKEETGASASGSSADEARMRSLPTAALIQEPQQAATKSRSLLRFLLAGRRGHNEAESSTPGDDKPDRSLFFKNMVKKMEESTMELAAQEAEKSGKPKGGRFHKLPILTEARAFTDEMEKAWFNEYLEGVLCKKIHPRIDRYILILFIMTIAEVLWNMPDPHYPGVYGWDKEHDEYGTRLRLPMFLIFRACIILLLVGVRWAASSTDWVKENAKGFQCTYVIAACFSILLLYFSYDVMIVGTIVRSEQKLLAPLDQLFSLIFVLIFFLVVRDRMLFGYSLVYIPLAFMIVIFVNIPKESGVYFPKIGQVLFIIIAISNSVLAHAEEQGSRAHFKAQHAVERTRKTVSDMLKSMMPPAVLAELQTCPAGTLPSHKYEACTLAQSDLCGFTALSSTRTPKEVVTFISELFGLFDGLTNEHGIYKVETVGDAYIAGQAERPLTAQNSPLAVIRFGIGMCEQVHEWSKRHGVDVLCRVGIHHGACVGGIVGAEMQRYHIFGAIMQGLEVLESTAPQGGVQISKACLQAITNECAENNIEVTTDKNMVSFESSRIEFQAVRRTKPQLVTSKGEVHSYKEIGGADEEDKSYVIKHPSLTTET